MPPKSSLEELTKKIQELEQALKDSENKYRFLFENMAQGAFYQRADSLLTDHNAAALEMFGLTADQFEGKTSLDPQWKVIHEDGTDFPGETHPSMVALKTGKPVKKTIAGIFNIHKNDYVWLSINAVPEFKDNESKPYQAFVTLHDITDLKVAKQALQKNEKQYRLLFENMMNGFALHEIITNEKKEPVDYVFLDVNSAFEKFTGLNKANIIGKKVTEVLPGTEKDPADWIGRYGDVALTGRAIRFEQFSQAIDKWFSVLAFSPQIGQFATIFQDITDRKRSELELKETQRLLEETQTITRLGGWEYNVESDQLIWTKEVFKIHGIDTIKNPVELDNAINFYGPDNAKVVERAFFEALNEAKPYDLDLELTRLDGQKIWIRTMGQPVIKEGKVVRVTGNILDITERKKVEMEKEQLQVQLLQAQKMESVGTLAGGIAHDFNNLLSIIIGNTELAIEDVPSWNPSFQNIQEIKTASFRARDVVKQLLSFSRKANEEQKPINIAPVVKESLKLIRSSIPTSIDIQDRTPLTSDIVLADATQIHQVMINLCTNAAHSMNDEKGKITVEMETIEIQEHMHGRNKSLSPGKYINLSIKDNGSGIKEKDIEKIFDPYFTTKEVGKGTGMGLSVVHGIVESHNGHMFVESEPELGTTFNIYFPVTNKNFKAESDLVFETKARGTGTILFVDDEKSIVDMFAQILKKIGYDVVATTDPNEAIIKFQAAPNHFSVVISDMTMPQMTGAELSKKIKAIRPETPVIICTGYNSMINEKKAKEMNIDAFVMKPVSMSEISKTIRFVLDQQK